MAGGGVVLAATRDTVVMIRNSTLFLLTLTDGQLVLRCTHELLQSLPSADEVAFSATDDAADDADNDVVIVGANTQHPPKQGIAATAFFQPDAANNDVYALLLLVDERKVVHYEANVAQGTVTLRSVRTMPRNATCMAVSSLRVGDSLQHMVIVGEKTGEAVAMPFPDLKRDRKILLGHTTSMITYIVRTTSEPALLLTADRDEKIRVSHFPRVALVQSYCLGHTAALTTVACSVATPQLAVSTSLDNTIKLWHMASGTLLDSHVLVGANTDASVQHNALRNVSLSLCASKNVVVVVLPSVGLRFFAIESGDEVDSFKLVAKTLAPQTQAYVTAHEPTDAAFTTEGSSRLLTIAYKQSPFLRVFEVTTTAGASSIALSERSANKEFTRLRKHAATIELPKEEAEETDDVDGGLTKKKIKLNNWKTKLPPN